MILCDQDIQHEMALRGVTIKPYNPDHLNPNSYDVTLSGHFALLKYLYDRPYYWLVTVPAQRKLFIPAGETVLAVTNEVVGGTGNITSQIRAKSSTRRLGISVCDDAGLGDVGYVNRWTMQLTANVQPYAPVTVGQRIAQMVFYYTATTPARPYSGQYAGASAAHAWPENMVPRQWRSHIIRIPYEGPETLTLASSEVRNWLGSKMVWAM